MRKKPKFRCTTGKAIAKLAIILDVPNTPEMQDWEWEIADSRRIHEYISLYQKDHMTDDDRVALLEILLESIEQRYAQIRVLPKQWNIVKKLVSKNSIIHQYTLFYWSCLEEYEPRYNEWLISKEVRKLYVELYSS